MSSLLQIRDVPDESRRVLKAKAASRGQSMNAYLLELIARDVARPAAADVFTRAALRAEKGTDSALAAVAAARGERNSQLGDYPA